MREKDRLTVIGTDPGIIQVDMDDQLLAGFAAGLVLLQADHERSPRQDRRNIVARPFVVAEKQVFVAFKTQYDMGLEITGFRVFVKEYRVFLVQLDKLCCERSSPIDTVAIPGAMPRIDSQILVVYIVKNDSLIRHTFVQRRLLRDSLKYQWHAGGARLSLFGAPPEHNLSVHTRKKPPRCGWGSFRDACITTLRC